MNIDYTNDIKVLGRVVSIAVDNKVAEAEQVFDSTFVYDSNATAGTAESTVGLDQATINRLFRDRLYKLEGAGLVPGQNGKIVITNPVEINNDLKVRNIEALTALISDLTATDGHFSGTLNTVNLHVSNNAVIDNNLTVAHDIVANNIKAHHKIEGAQLIITGDNNETGDLHVKGKLTVDEGLDVNGNAKFFDNITVDGNTIVNNLTVNGDFDIPHATTSRYGIVRLATNLSDTYGDNVVPVSMFRQYYQLILDNPNTQAIDSIKELLDYVNQHGANVPTSLDDLNDVGLITPAQGDILYYDGTQWVNRSLNTFLQPLVNQINALNTRVNALETTVNNLGNTINNFTQRIEALEGGALWEWNGSYIVPKTSGRSVATTGNGKFYSGI